VIGVGNLGSCIAYEIANRGLVDELVLVDILRELAEGNAADIKQAVAFRNNVEVTAGDYSDAEGSQVIVVTAGKPRTPEIKSRMELLAVNKGIVSNVALNIKGLKSEPVVITLTNPVDIMNYLMWRGTGLNRRKTLGSGGMLDSARFRTVLGRKTSVPIVEIEAYVIGEHGDNQVPLFSQIRMEGQRAILGRGQRAELANELKESALNVISKKGATIFAPANTTVNMVEAILRDEKRVAVCSVVLDGEYGLRDVSIGVPVRLGKQGVEAVLEWELEEEEKRLFHNGAEYLRRTLQEIIAS